MMKLADEGKLKFIPAFEMSYIGKKNQQYIASTIESEERAPTLAQVQRMRELDQKGQLTPTVISVRPVGIIAWGMLKFPI